MAVYFALFYLLVAFVLLAKCCADMQISEWSPCSATCGLMGEQTRSMRQCVEIVDSNSTVSHNCVAKEERRSCVPLPLPCFNAPVPTAPQWTPWSQWTICNKFCGGGMQTRFRLCVGGNRTCANGTNQDSQPCNTFTCPSKLAPQMEINWKEVLPERVRQHLNEALVELANPNSILHMLRSVKLPGPTGGFDRSLDSLLPGFEEALKYVNFDQLLRTLPKELNSAFDRLSPTTQRTLLKSLFDKSLR